MRILNQGILQSSFAQRALVMVKTIQAKFKNPQSLLQISPAVQGNSSIWSEIEQVFSMQVSGKAEIPGEPGTLRRGSVIERLETIPQPDQSLQSFKKQIQDRPVLRKAEEISQPKKSNPPPRDRLSARVQELTAPQKEKKSTEPRNVDKQAESPPAAPETRQQQPEPQVPSGTNIETTLGTFESNKLELPLARPIQAPKVDRPELPAALPVKRLAQPISSKTTTPRAAPARPAQQPPKSGLLQRQPLPHPAPSPSVSRTMQRQVETGKPVQKVKATQPGIQLPKTRLDSQPSEETPEPPENLRLPAKREHPQGQPDILPGAQPQVSIPASAANLHLPEKPEPLRSSPEIPPGRQPIRGMPQSAAKTAAPHEPLPTRLEPAKKSPEIRPGGQAAVSLPGSAGTTPALVEHLPAASEQPQSPPEMPLARHLRQRSAAIEGLRAEVRGHVPSITPPPWSALKIGVIQRKTIVASEGPRPAAHPVSQSPSHPFSLHYPPAAGKTSTSTVDIASSAAGNVIQTTTAPVEIVQRKSGEIAGDEDEPQEPSSPAPQSSVQQLKNARTSPQQLAEKILPLVKRLLEIEAERTGRQFH
jgi:hypothetical protein